MGFDEPCQLTVSMCATYAVVDLYLGQRDYFFQRGREMLRQLGPIRTNTDNPARIYEYSVYTRFSNESYIRLLYCEGRSRSTPSMIGIPAETARSSAARRRGQTEKWYCGRV